jgi:hypothetical protein
VDDRDGDDRTLTQRSHALPFRVARPWNAPKTKFHHLRQQTPRDILPSLRGQSLTLPVRLRADIYHGRCHRKSKAQELKVKAQMGKRDVKEGAPHMAETGASTIL